MQPLNPYIVGNAVGGSPAFVGRDDILREVYRLLQNPGQNAILLHGQRRIGKTSILRQLETKLPEEGNYCPIFIDLLGKAHQPVEQIVQELATQISDKLGKGKPQLGDDPKTSFHKTWLPNLLDTETTSLVLLFDEFDALDDDLAKQTRAEFFRYFRDLLSIHRERLNFIFVIGRNVGDLTQIALALFRDIPTKPISLLNREETLKLIRLSKDNNTLQWSPKAEEKVWQLTQGHPYLTQQLCFCVWEYEHVIGVPNVPSKHVEMVVPTVLERSEGALEWLWDGLEAAQKIFLSAVAETGNRVVTKKQLNDSLSKIGIKVSVPALEKAPQSLSKSWDLIEEITENSYFFFKGENRYHFKVELLRQLVAKYKPLVSIKDELNRLEAQANLYYKSAIKLRDDKKLEEALEELGRVLRLNPNHIATVQLQTEILLEQKRLEDAYKKAEELLQEHPDEGRPLLIQTLWAMAHFSEKENEQLDCYQKILQFDHNHLGAKGEIKKIWTHRGDRDKRDEDCKGAIHAYRKAEAKEKLFQVRKDCWSKKYAKPMRILAEFIFGFIFVYTVSFFTPVGSFFLGYGSDKIILKVEKQKEGYRLIYGENPLVEKPRPVSLTLQEPVAIFLELANNEKKPLITKNTQSPYTYEVPEGQQKQFSDNKLPLVFSIPKNLEENTLEKLSCKVKDEEKPSCEVRKKPWVDIPFFLKNISWQIWAILYGILLVVIGEMLIFRKRNQREEI